MLSFLKQGKHFIPGTLVTHSAETNPCICGVPKGINSTSQRPRQSKISKQKPYPETKKEKVLIVLLATRRRIRRPDRDQHLGPQRLIWHPSRLFRKLSVGANRETRELSRQPTGFRRLRLNSAFKLVKFQSHDTSLANFTESAVSSQGI